MASKITVKLDNKLLNLYKGNTNGDKRRNQSQLRLFKPKNKKIRRQNKLLQKLYKKQTAKRLRITRSALSEYFRIAENSKYSIDEKFDLMKLEIKKMRGMN